MENSEWHLSKTFNIALIFAIIGMIITASIAWANMENEIEKNSEHNAIFHSSIKTIEKDVKEIREGLIAEGIIKI